MEKLTRVEVMKRATFIKVKKKMILKCDLSFLDSAEDVGRVTEYFRSMVKKMPPKSLVGLVDFTGLKVADEVVPEMIRLTKFCNPYFRATAVIAQDEATIGLATDEMNPFGKVNIPVYQEKELATEWLFTQ